MAVSHAAETVYHGDNQQLIEQMLEHHNAGFVGLEHQEYGDTVQLHWEPLTKPHPLGRLHLPNGLELSYGDIVALGGDLFGDPSCVISDSKPEQRNSCFKRHFADLALPQDTNNPTVQAIALLSYFSALSKQLEYAREQGQSDWQFYGELGSEFNKQLNRLTGGGSLISSYLPFGQYLKLAQVNFDHFVPDSLIAYQVGHRVALGTAQHAHALFIEGKLSDASLALQLAYAQNAFANHYLTDSMSSGHMRTPRRAIHNELFLPAILKLLIANLMHDEDSQFGLMVWLKLASLWRCIFKAPRCCYPARNFKKNHATLS